MEVRPSGSAAQRERRRERIHKQLIQRDTHWCDYCRRRRKERKQETFRNMDNAKKQSNKMNRERQAKGVKLVVLGEDDSDVEDRLY